jgi:hypothetical protein
MFDCGFPEAGARSNFPDEFGVLDAEGVDVLFSFEQRTS